MQRENSSKAAASPRRLPPLLALGLTVAMLAAAALTPEFADWRGGRAEGAGPPRSKKSGPARKPRRPPPTPAPKPPATPKPAIVNTPWVVLGYNELGMHCMNQDFSEICILPPFNNLRAQVIVRGEDPHIVTSGATVSYKVPGNTSSAGKTNFWTYA